MSRITDERKEALVGLSALVVWALAGLVLTLDVLVLRGQAVDVLHLLGCADDCAAAIGRGLGLARVVALSWAGLAVVGVIAFVRLVILVTRPSHGLTGAR